ncbi:MAG: ATP-binding protein, partial [Deinococcota bacterium]|nr:ATP-binding protein [Deinococcota bacterium]
YLVAEGKRRAGGSGEAGDEAVQGTLEHVHKELLEVVKQLRGVIGELRPAALEELGLRVALEGLAAQLTRTAGESGASGPEIALDIHLEDDLPRPVARCVFRVAQEALRNALRYARASRITLRLRSAAGLTLTVTDDGSGFCVPQHLSELAKEDHFGLVGMAEQVASVSGELSIRSQPGKGTEVAVAIPIPKGPATEGPVTKNPASEQRMTAGQGVKPRG